VIWLILRKWTRCFFQASPDCVQNFSRRQIGHGVALSIVAQRVASCTARDVFGVRSAINTRPSSELS